MSTQPTDGNVAPRREPAIDVSSQTSITVETRRERLRRELKADIVTNARSQLESGGRAGVTWRGLAREVGMNPASLYTYFDSLDDVFTAVILDSFNRLGSTLQATAAECAGCNARDRLMATSRAFRRWALDHPGEFNLVFTDQIPGYAAPPDGPTVEAQLSIFGPFLEAIAELMDREVDPTALPSQDDPANPIGLWALMHGLVMLEINHHLAFIEDPELLFDANMERAADALLGG